METPVSALEPVADADETTLSPRDERNAAVSKLAQLLYDEHPFVYGGVQLTFHGVPSSVFDAYDGTIGSAAGAVWKTVKFGRHIEAILFLEDKS